MTKTSQDFTMYAGERKTLHIRVIDQDNNDAVLDNLDSEFTVVKWALTQVSPQTGDYSTAPIVEKKSNVVQSETGGNEIDFSNGAGTNDAADVELINADTDSLAGEYYHELEGFDSAGEGVVLATGTITILRNVENT